MATHTSGMFDLPVSHLSDLSCGGYKSAMKTAHSYPWEAEMPSAALFCPLYEIKLLKVL